MDLDKVVNTFRALLNRANPVNTIISLLDPELPHLMAFTAAIMDKTPEDVAKSIKDTIAELSTLWTSLPKERRNCLELWCHSTLPNARALMIDEQSGTGLIQLETKAYKAPRIDSFAIEIHAGTEFYSMLQCSYADLIKDGRQILPSVQ